MTILFFSQSCTKQEMEPERNQAATNRMQYDFSTEINKTYFQDWVSGVRGGGAGTNFYIVFEKQLPKEIILGDLFFRDKKAPATAISETTYQSRFSNKENNPRDDISANGSESRMVSAPFPIKDNQALLEYYENGELKYYLITNVKEVQLDSYPE